MQLKKNDFEKSEQFETKDVGRVISTSSVLVLTRKRERESGTRMAKRPDARESKKKIRLHKSPKVYYSSINLINASNNEY